MEEKQIFEHFEEDGAKRNDSEAFQCEKQKLFEHFEEDVQWELSLQGKDDFFRVLTTAPSTPRILQILGEKNLSQGEILEILIEYSPKILSCKIWEELSFHIVFSWRELEFLLREEIGALKNIKELLNRYIGVLPEDFLQEFEGFLFNPHFALNYLLETLSGLVPLKENQPDLEDIDDEDLDLEDIDDEDLDLEDIDDEDLDNLI